LTLTYGAWHSSRVYPVFNAVFPLRRVTLGCYQEGKISDKDSNFKLGRVRTYPIGAVVRVRLISGRETEGQVIKVETTALGTFMHVEFGEEVAHVTGKQVIGFYDFCFLKAWMVRRF
jgi:hypothetical protein